MREPITEEYSYIVNIRVKAAWISIQEVSIFQLFVLVFTELNCIVFCWLSQLFLANELC